MRRGRRSASGSFKKFPNAKRYTDFRKMFDEMDKDIEAVSAAMPDHTHAVACMAAIRGASTCTARSPWPTRCTRPAW